MGKLFLPLILFPAILAGAKAVSKEEEGVLFQSRVWPILEKSCIRCHGQEKHKGDLRLDSREAVLKGGKDGPAIVPGKPSESLLLKLVRHQDPDREMPPKDPLHEAEIAALEQ